MRTQYQATFTLICDDGTKYHIPTTVEVTNECAGFDLIPGMSTMGPPQLSGRGNSMCPYFLVYDVRNFETDKLAGKLHVKADTREVAS